ncbi:MAG: hypothetical protein GPJ51_13005 [Candidatus Heimdallarchaeota archaeon]|nr:hypothetical protein [Candidatus Heimdallarchaeota archaeon]
MNKKLTVLTVLLGCILLIPSTTSADLPTGIMKYANEVIPDAEYKWEVTTLESGGAIIEMFPTDIHVGNAQLAEGDEVKLIVLEDPDETSDIWYDIFVNDDRVTTPDDIWIGYLESYGLYNSFITPVSYTNNSGTYNLYEQMFEELDQVDATYEDVTGVFSYQIEFLVQYSILGDIFKTTYSEDVYFTDGSGITEVLLVLETTFNTQTGVLETSRIDFEYSSNMYGYDKTAFLHFLLESKSSGIPFDWMFGFLSISVIAAIITLIRRKRR